MVTGDIQVTNCEDTPDGPVCNNYIITGEVEGVNNYYPFGLLHNNQYTNFDNAYQYKYNGKELQESGMYDYGARFYMPDVGRWGVVDPLAFLYYNKSTYSYANNNPLSFIDPNGKEIIGVTKEDAIQAQTDIHAMFSDKRFDSFRSLISVKGKNFNKIEQEKLKAILSNSDLSDDDKTLIEIVSNTINSKDEHVVEYANNETSLVSSKAVEAFGFPLFLNKEKTKEMYGGIPAAVYSAGGGSITSQTKKGSFSLIVGGQNPNDYLDQTGNHVPNPIGRVGITGMRSLVTEDH